MARNVTKMAQRHWTGGHQACRLVLTDPPGRAGGRLVTRRRCQQNFEIFLQNTQQIPYSCNLSHLGCFAPQKKSLTYMFKSLPLSVREVRATEATLERIYKAAYLGLKNDALALSAGLLPVEYRRLKEFDQMAELAEQKGRADNERENSQLLQDAARAGDAKAALAILQHVHGWVAKQAISVEVEQRISVIDALRAAESRVIEGSVVPLEVAREVAREVPRETTPSIAHQKVA